MANASKKQWRRIADCRVAIVWKRVCDCARTGGTMAGDEVAVVPAVERFSPKFYDENGTPTCDCGEDLRYSHTEILINQRKA